MENKRIALIVKLILGSVLVLVLLFALSGIAEFYWLKSILNSATGKITSWTGMNVWLARAVAGLLLALVPVFGRALMPAILPGAAARKRVALWELVAVFVVSCGLLYAFTKDNVLGKYYVYDPISNRIDLYDAGGLDPRTSQERRPIDNPRLAQEVRLFVARTEGKLSSTQVFFDQNGEALYRYYRLPDGRLEVYPRFLSYHPRYGQQMPLLSDADVVRQYEAQMQAARTAVRPPQGRPSVTPKRSPPARARPAVASDAAKPAGLGPDSDGVVPSASEIPSTSGIPSAPEIAVAPEPVIKTVARGTSLRVVLLRGLSSKASRPGDLFTGRVGKDIFVDGVTVIPADSEVSGSVTHAVPQPKVGGAASLALEFTKIRLPGGAEVPIRASWARTGKSKTGKDAAKIGGAAGAGALLGRLLGGNDKTKSSAIGAVVGGAGGTAIAASTGGQEVEIAAGTAIDIQLEELAQVRIVVN